MASAVLEDNARSLNAAFRQHRTPKSIAQGQGLRFPTDVILQLTRAQRFDGPGDSFSISRIGHSVTLDMQRLDLLSCPKDRSCVVRERSLLLARLDHVEMVRQSRIDVGQGLREDVGLLLVAPKAEAIARLNHRTQEFA